MDLEDEILRVLNGQTLRFSEIKKLLYPKFKFKVSAGKLKHKVNEKTFNVTLSRRLKKLKREELIQRFEEGHQNVRYAITEKGIREVRERDLRPLLSSLDEEWFDRLRNLIVRIKQDGGKPEALCFAFIGDIPFAFSKTVDMMQDHITTEESLRERHLRDIEKIREEIEKSNPDVSMSDWFKDFDARVREEVGWKIGEYVMKLLKKTEKEKGIRKLMTFYGLTDEMIKEMGHIGPIISARKKTEIEEKKKLVMSEFCYYKGKHKVKVYEERWTGDWLVEALENFEDVVHGEKVKIKVGERWNTKRAYLRVADGEKPQTPNRRGGSG